MGRIVRWGVDGRGRRQAPVPLVRLVPPARRKLLAPTPSGEAPEPMEEMPFGMEPLLFSGPRLEPNLPDIDDAGEPPEPYDDDGEALDEGLRHVRVPADLGRFLAAMERKAAARRNAPRAPRPLPVAASREECPLCGVPGFRGCEHQAPCPDGPLDGRAIANGARPSALPREDF